METLQLCSNCKVYRPVRDFTARNGRYRTCITCRRRQSNVLRPASEFATTIEEMIEFIPTRTDAGVSYVYEADVLIEGFMLQLTDDRALLMHIISQIEACDGYMYYLKNLANPRLRRSISFKYVCCQDARVQSQVPDEVRARLHSRMRTHPCNGKISGYIDRESGYVYLKIQHSSGHPPPRLRENIRTEMPREVREYIVEHAEELSAQPLYRRIVAQFPTAAGTVTQPQVYASWARQVESQFKLHENQLTSAIMHVDRGTNGVCKILYRNYGGVVGFGFVTEFFVSACASPFVREFHVDSTYKTNRMGYELFGVVANFNGCGFPIAYMLLGVNDGVVPEHERAPSRQEMIRRFFRSLQTHGFAPDFIFSDKDRGQINAIETVFGRHPLRLCLWHIQRAVKLRLGEDKRLDPRYNAVDAREQFPFVSLRFVPPSDRSGKICPNSDQRDQIVAMVRKHYHMHPHIPLQRVGRENADQLRQRAGRELYRFCVRHNLPDVWAYMYNCWYARVWWDRWARSSRPDNIPMAKTTMMIEAQWRVLKRDFLLNFPRPRLDLLMYIIINQQLPLMRANFQLKIQNRRQALEWEKEFARSWRTLTQTLRRRNGGEEANADERYMPSVEDFTCGCPAFINSRFMLCKHLVKRYNDTVRQSWGLFSALDVYTQRKDTAPYVHIEEEIQRYPFRLLRLSPLSWPRRDQDDVPTTIDDVSTNADHPLDEDTPTEFIVSQETDILSVGGIQMEGDNSPLSLGDDAVDEVDEIIVIDDDDDDDDDNNGDELIEDDLDVDADVDGEGTDLWTRLGRSEDSLLQTYQRHQQLMQQLNEARLQLQEEVAGYRMMLPPNQRRTFDDAFLRGDTEGYVRRVRQHRNENIRSRNSRGVHPYTQYYPL